MTTRRSATLAGVSLAVAIGCTLVPGTGRAAPTPEPAAVPAGLTPHQTYARAWQAVFADPANPQLNYELGRAAMEIGLYENAAAAYERVLMVDPHLVAARFELGRAYFELQSYAMAKTELAQVLAAHPEEPILSATHRYLAEIGKRTASHRLDIAVSLGLIYDTNANVGPADGIIDTVFGPITLGPASTEEEDAGTLISLQGRHRWSPDQDTGFAWVNRLAYRSIAYFRKSEFNLAAASLATGPTYGQGAWGLELPVTADLIEFGSDAYAEYYGLAPSAAWGPSSEVSLGSRLTLQSRDYDTNPNLDGSYAALELLPRYIDPQMRYWLQCQLGYTWENTEAGFEENDGPLWGVSVFADLHERLKGLVQLENQYLGFDDPDPIHGRPRNDTRIRATLSLVAPLPWWDLDLGLSYVATRNRSNLDEHDYLRQQTTCMITKRF
ncbi:MAG: tetratricopeptide repeat protein [Thermodesulfobacteriota bacterium]